MTIKLTYSQLAYLTTFPSNPPHKTVTPLTRWCIASRECSQHCSVTSSLLGTWGESSLFTGRTWTNIIRNTEYKIHRIYIIQNIQNKQNTEGLNIQNTEERICRIHRMHLRLQRAQNTKNAQNLQDTNYRIHKLQHIMHIIRSMQNIQIT